MALQCGNYSTTPFLRSAYYEDISCSSSEGSLPPMANFDFSDMHKSTLFPTPEEKENLTFDWKFGTTNLCYMQENPIYTPPTSISPQLEIETKPETCPAPSMYVDEEVKPASRTNEYVRSIKRTNSKKGTRLRTQYTIDQLVALEDNFQQNNFLSRIQKIRLAQSLKLTEKQVKVWFQNRRMKSKKEEGRRSSRTIMINGLLSPAATSSSEESGPTVILPDVDPNQQQNGSETFSSQTSYQSQIDNILLESNYFKYEDGENTFYSDTTVFNPHYTWDNNMPTYQIEPYEEATTPYCIEEL